MKLNCMVLLSDNIAIRADEVRRIDVGVRRTEVTLEDGAIYRTSMSVAEVADAVNRALNSARRALMETEE